MCLHAARLPARVDAVGDLLPLATRIARAGIIASSPQGIALLERSATGDELSAYHVEAAIAAVHASARTRETPTGRRSWRSTIG